MAKIGIFFGTNSGTTRLVAKKIAKRLGDAVADAPINVNRISTHQFLSYDSLILGTPSYGDGQLPSGALGIKDGSWQEFLALLEDADLSGKTIALYGLGDQVKYKGNFANALGKLCKFFRDRGAKVVGQWSTEGYEFEASEALDGSKFCGLVLDNDNQGMLTDKRIEEWSALVLSQLVRVAA